MDPYDDVEVKCVEEMPEELDDLEPDVSVEYGPYRYDADFFRFPSNIGQTLMDLTGITGASFLGSYPVSYAYSEAYNLVEGTYPEVSRLMSENAEIAVLGASVYLGFKTYFKGKDKVKEYLEED